MGEPLRKLERGGVHNEHGQLSGGYMIQEREMTVAVRVVSRCLGGEGKVKEAVVQGLVGAGARGQHPASTCIMCMLMPTGSSVHGILQTRTLEWIAIPFPGGSSPPRDRTWVSCIAVRFFTH